MSPRQLPTRFLISSDTSATWFRAGLTSMGGSTSPVGRTSCSTGGPLFSSSYAAGVAEI